MAQTSFLNSDSLNLNLPPVELKLVRRNGILRVFDPLRKNYFIVTPEELVRQSFVAWLINYLHYPSPFMANEIGIRLNETFKRCDTVVFKQDGKPLMIIEYKAPTVNLNQDVFDQIVRYNLVLNAPFLVVSNGIKHYCCKTDLNSFSYSFLTEIPDYNQIKALLS